MHPRTLSTKLQHARSFSFNTHILLTPPTSPLMEQTASLEISATAPIIECERDICKRKLSRALAKRVKVRVTPASNDNGDSRMLVCPDCYLYYRDKSTTIRKFLTYLWGVTLRLSSYRSYHSISRRHHSISRRHHSISRRPYSISRVYHNSISRARQRLSNSKACCRISKGCVIFTPYLRHAYIFPFR